MTSYTQNPHRKVEDVDLVLLGSGKRLTSLDRLCARPRKGPHALSHSVLLTAHFTGEEPEARGQLTCSPN